MIQPIYPVHDASVTSLLLCNARLWLTGVRSQCRRLAPNPGKYFLAFHVQISKASTSQRGDSAVQRGSVLSEVLLVPYEHYFRARAGPRSRATSINRKLFWLITYSQS